MTWVTATSRRKEGLTGTDWRRKGQAGDHRTANKRGASRSGAGRTGAERRKWQVPEQAGTGRKGRAGRKEQADRKGQAQAGAARGGLAQEGANW